MRLMHWAGRLAFNKEMKKIKKIAAVGGAGERLNAVAYAWCVGNILIEHPCTLAILLLFFSTLY